MRCVRAVELLIPTQVHHGTLGPLLQRDGLAVELGGRGRHGSKPPFIAVAVARISDECQCL